MLKKCVFFSLFLMILPFHIQAKIFLRDYAYNKHSQYGEDGIIQKIFEIMGTTSKICIEFGAWDGIHLSNTANLWLYDLSWKAYLIESDNVKFEDLVANTRGRNCCAIHAWVGIENDNKLETILQKHGFDFDSSVDLLSIDIDSNDYYIFESLERIRPRLVICEYNPTMPHYLEIREPYSPTAYFGCSAGALERLAEKKGYKLIAMTLTNCFFVRNEDLHLFEHVETDLQLIHDKRCYMFLITSYDGRYALVTESLKKSPYGIRKPYQDKLIGDFQILSFTR